MTRTFYFDNRWDDLHGIGRFSREVRAHSRLLKDSGLQGEPLSVGATWTTSRFLDRPDKLLFTPGFNGSLWRQSQVCMTVHDLIHLNIPEEQSRSKAAYYGLIVKPTLRRAPLVFTVSEYTKGMIAAWAKIPPEKIIVASNGRSPAFSMTGPTYHQTRPYVLYVGNWRPHKNVPTLLKAFKAVAPEYNLELLASGRESEEALKAIEQAGVRERVRFLGRLSDEELATYYRGALVTVMPSRFEGFGFPVLEAMACGCPVISSSSTSLPEVGGQVPLYFHPDSADELVDQLRRVASGQIQREELAEQGQVRASLFDWKTVASRIDSSLGQLNA